MPTGVIDKARGAVQKLGDRLRSKPKELKETPVDPVQALNNFVKRLEDSSETNRTGQLIAQHLEERERQYRVARSNDPALTPEGWIKQVVSRQGTYTNAKGERMQEGDIVESVGWNMKGKHGDISKKPGDFGPSWNNQQVEKFLGEDNVTMLQRKERTFNTDRKGSFRLKVRGDYGPGSEGESTAAYREQAITLPKKGEKESGVAVVLQVEKPYEGYGVGYAFEGAILGLGFQIPVDTMVKYLHQKTSPAPAPTPAHH